MRSSHPFIARHLAAARALAVLTVLLGLAYPLAMVAVAQVPALESRADGSIVEVDGSAVGSRLIGQAFTDPEGNPLPQYFQSRPSAAGDGYDPTASAASNLGPEDIIDTPDRPSLLSQVCSRSLAIGELEGVDGSRPYCTDGGVGAVLGVYYSDGLTGDVVRVVSLNETAGSPFLAEYRGVPVELATESEDYTAAVLVPVRGDAPAEPAVPADAVTASGSGLDPHISPAYAQLQADRIAAERGTDVRDVRALIQEHTSGRFLGALGEPTVNVLELNIALDENHPQA